MKKALCILFCLTLIISLSACVAAGSSDNSAPDSNRTTSSQDSTLIPTLPNEYATIINNIINAYPWNDDDMNMVPENPELSYMYRRNSELSEIGFALIDLDGNGQEELIISDPSKFVYDLYTISNGKAVHLFDSGERYCYILRENGIVENSWSGSAVTSGHDFYKLNDGKLDFVERITFDAYHAEDVGVIKELTEANADNCFFISPTDQFEDYKSVTSREAIEKIESYQNANKELEIEYTLLSERNKNNKTLADLYASTKNNDKTYSYKFYDLNNNILFQKEDVVRQPKINQIAVSIYELKTQTGTGLSTNWAVYCDVENSKVSETFHYVLGSKGDYVVCADYEESKHFITVQNIFDKSVYYKTYELENVSPVAADFALDCKFDNDNKVTITYLTGEDYTETKLTIDIQ